MPEFQFVGNIVESNGKTIKENNLAIQHDIPIGTLVEVNCDYLPEHGTRQFIAAHGRDCDGSPLYVLTHTRNMCDDQIIRDGGGVERSQEYIDLYRRMYHHGGWDKNSLIIIDSNLAEASQQGYEEAVKEIADMARTSPHLVHPLFIPAIEGLPLTRKANR